MLVDKGRLRPPASVARWVDEDSADRILIAAARCLGCPLVTRDGKILAYAAQGHRRAVDARHQGNSPCSHQRRSARRYSQKRAPASSSTW
jgi:hypothetical protein